MRYVSGLIALGLVAASCGSGDEAAVVAVRADRSSGTASDATGTESTLPTVEEWDERAGFDDQAPAYAPLDTRFEGQPYAFTIDISLEIDGEPHTFDLTGAVDPAERRGFIVGKTIDIATDRDRGDDEVDLDAIDPNLELIQVMDGGESHARGLIPELGFPDEVEPQRWYVASPYTDDVSDMNILDQYRVVTDFVALLGSVGAEFENRVFGDGVMLSGTLHGDELDVLRETDSVFETAPYADEVDFVTTAAPSGHITGIEFSAVTDEGPGEMRIEITDVGEPIVLPDVIDSTNPWDTLPREPEDITPFEESIDAAETAPLLISTNGSFRMPGLVDVTYVFEADGDVLRIIDGNIYTGPSGYTTWSLGPDGRAILEQLILDSNLSGRHKSTQASSSGGVRGTISSGGIVQLLRRPPRRRNERRLIDRHEPPANVSRSPRSPRRPE